MTYQEVYTKIYEYINYKNILANTLDFVGTKIMQGIGKCVEKSSNILSDANETIKKKNDVNKVKTKIKNIFDDAFPLNVINVCHTGKYIYAVFPKNMQIISMPTISNLYWTVKFNGESIIHKINKYHGIRGMIRQGNLYFLDITDFILDKGFFEIDLLQSIDETVLSNDEENNHLINQVIILDDD